MRLADTPDKLQPGVAPILATGTEVGLRLSIIARPTRAEAVRAAYALVAGLDAAERAPEKEKDFVRRSDSLSINATYQLAETEWLSPSLWTGAVRSHGAPSIALVGTPEEVAERIQHANQLWVPRLMFVLLPVAALLIMV